ncbi:MAG: CdaR family protein, partial [Dehalococcoidia bacterium]
SIALPAVNVYGARSEIVRSVAIPLTPGLSFVDTERATVTVTIAEITSTLRITTAVMVDGLGAGLDATLEPGNVTIVVEGPLPVLNALASGEIRASIDLAGRGAGVYSVAVEVTVPDGVTVVSVQPADVTVTIR